MDSYKKKKKKSVEVVVISDVHLGTYGCHAKELLSYLKSINPSIVILNGDIIDIWQFSKHQMARICNSCFHNAFTFNR